MNFVANGQPSTALTSSFIVECGHARSPTPACYAHLAQLGRAIAGRHLARRPEAIDFAALEIQPLLLQLHFFN